MKGKKIKTVKFRSLTFTLTVTFLLLIFVILMIYSTLNTYFSYQTQQRTIDEQQRFLAENSANIVRSFIVEKISVMQTAVRLGNLMESANAKPALDKLIGLEPSFKQVALFDVQNREIARTSRFSFSASRELMRNELLSKTGQGGTYISPVYIDNISSEPMIIVGIPVMDASRSSRGVLISEINLKFMWDLVGSIKVGKTGYVYVVDAGGDLIAFGDVSRVLEGQNLANLHEVREFMSGGNSTEELAEVSVGLKGEPVVSDYVALGTPDWAVVVEIPVHEAYDPIVQQVLFAAVIFGLNILLAVLIGLYSSRRITSPIIALRNAAIKIGQGDMRTKIEVKTSDEIGQLANEFNNMTKNLKDYKSRLEKYSKGLEKEVAKRTEELAAKNDTLERFNRLAVGRELKMIELKKKIADMEGKKKGGKTNPPGTVA